MVNVKRGHERDADDLMDIWDVNECVPCQAQVGQVYVAFVDTPTGVRAGLASPEGGRVNVSRRATRKVRMSVAYRRHTTMSVFFRDRLLGRRTTHTSLLHHRQISLNGPFFSTESHIKSCSPRVVRNYDSDTDLSSLSLLPLLST